MTGKNVHRGKIGTIFGLDPAGPLFSVNNPAERLASGDASYVEGIHTNGRANGIGGELISSRVAWEFLISFLWKLISQLLSEMQISFQMAEWTNQDVQQERDVHTHGQLNFIVIYSYQTDLWTLNQISWFILISGVSGQQQIHGE